MTKGRRVGFTHSAALFLIKDCFKKSHRYLWVDTIYGNINRYYERYFLPTLNKIPKDLWEWNKQLKILKIYDSICDFRSADRPESIEGFGYSKIILNEAGIILKGESGRYIWDNAILPMTMDYKDCVLYIGGTPKGKRGKDGLPTKYFELYQKAVSGNTNYSHVNIPTNKNPFINQDSVLEVKQELPEGPIRDQEFYGKFVDAGSGMIRPEWFHISDTPINGEKIRSWDLAATVKKSSDYSAGSLCCYNDTMFQVQDVKRVKLLWPELKELIIATAEHDGYSVPVILENSGQQNMVISDLRDDKRLMRHTIIDVRPVGDKLARAMPWISRLEGGRVSILRGIWNIDFINECTAFTIDDSHAYDDQVDSISQAWGYCKCTKVNAYIL